MKQVINFKAEGQTLTSLGGIQKYASNTVAYVEARFELGEDWAFDIVTAVWQNNEQKIATLIEDGACIVPAEVLADIGVVKVNLAGSDIENNELVERLTTYPEYAILVDATAQVDGTETVPLTPSQFEQYVAIVSDLVHSVKDIDRIELNEDYTLTVYYSDGTSYTTESIRGEAGPEGPEGPEGPQGEPGEVTLAQLEQVLPTDTASGSIASFPDGSDLFDYLACVVDIDPVQDLNGYDKPWVGGAGANVFQPFGGTGRGIVFTPQDDGTVKISGTVTVSGWPQVQKDYTLEELGWSVGDAFYNYVGSNEQSGSAVRFLDGNGTQIGQISSNSSGTVPQGTVTVRFIQIGARYTAPSVGDVIDTVGHFYVCKGTTAPTAWTPYSNICPITGWTGCEVVRTGENRINPSVAYSDIGYNPAIGTVITPTVSANQWTDSGNGVYTISSLGSWAQAGFISPKLPNGTVKFQIDNVQGSVKGGIYVLDSNMKVLRISQLNNPITNGSSFSVNTTFSGDDAYLAVYLAGSGNNASITKPRLYIDSNIDINTYTPYNGTTYPVSWQTEAGTVYGGTVDLVSGVLTLTHALWTKNTSTMDNSESYPGWKNSDVSSIVGTGVNSPFPDIWTNVGRGVGINTSGVNDIVYLPTNYYGLTQTQWIALAQDVQILLPLATPTTYQLTPIQVHALLGQNNVWADCGDVEVQYKADVQLWVLKKLGE